MTEQEYEQVKNLSKMRCIATLMKDIMPGDYYGVDGKVYREAYQSILDMECKLLNTVKVEG